jgi:hypothetical protein
VIGLRWPNTGLENQKWNQMQRCFAIAGWIGITLVGLRSRVMIASRSASELCAHHALKCHPALDSTSLS